MLNPKTKVAIYLVSLFVLILSSYNIFAQSLSWHSSGPFLELDVEGITYFHSDPNIMLAGSNGVLYRSEDAGETWEYQCFYEGTIATIEIDPFKENVIYIGTNNTDGIYKSENSGETWSQIGLEGAWVNTIAIDKNNTELIFAGAGAGKIGIFKSTDGGGTWVQTYSEEIRSVNEIIFDLDNSSTIYASITAASDERDEGAFLKSTDSGDSWIRLHIAGDWYPESYGLIQSPGATNYLYCISDGTGNREDLWRSSDKGETWESIFIYYYDGSVSFVAVDPQNSNILYASGDTDNFKGEYYKSTNNGNNWIKVSNENAPRNISSMLINPNDGRLTIANYWDGIFQSTTGGASWEACSVNSYITDLAIHPSHDDTLFAAISGDLLFKSNDGNNSWQKETSSKTDDNVVSFSTRNPEIVAAASGKYFHKSNDGGDYFDNHYYSFMSCSDSPCDSYPEEILFHPNNANKIIVGTSGDNGVLSMSNNGGTEWGYIEFSTSTFLFDPTNSNNIYAGTKNEGGVFKIESVWGTTLNIINMTPSMGIGNVNDIAIDIDSKLYVATEDGLWHWDGSEWRILDGLPNDNVTAILLDEYENYTNLYAGTENNGVYYSEDSGISWTEFNNGLEKLSITKLAISKTNSKRLYAGTMRGGVWSTDLVVGIDKKTTVLPSNFSMSQNYPNPFNPSTMVKYGIPEQSNIRIEVFNMLGQSVGVLVNGNKSAGYYETTWNAENLPSGLYLISLRADGLNSKKSFTQVRKALLLK